MGKSRERFRFSSTLGRQGEPRGAYMDIREHGEPASLPVRHSIATVERRVGLNGKCSNAGFWAG